METLIYPFACLCSDSNTILKTNVTQVHRIFGIDIMLMLDLQDS